ncbi:hypothetical protein CRUP_014209 [Coryphaenoides rupestris]|nr:hypothetical protein CRUP_014209 [Coryphaenoides rupestris]
MPGSVAVGTENCDRSASTCGAANAAAADIMGCVFCVVAMFQACAYPEGVGRNPRLLQQVVRHEASHHRVLEEEEEEVRRRPRDPETRTGELTFHDPLVDVLTRSVGIGQLYSADTMKQYLGRSLGTLPPHVYAIGGSAHSAAVHPLLGGTLSGGPGVRSRGGQIRGTDAGTRRRAALSSIKGLAGSRRVEEEEEAETRGRPHAAVTIATLDNAGAGPSKQSTVLVHICSILVLGEGGAPQATPTSPRPEFQRLQRELITEEGAEGPRDDIIVDVDTHEAARDTWDVFTLQVHEHSGWCSRSSGGPDVSSISGSSSGGPGGSGSWPWSRPWSRRSRSCWLWILRMSSRISSRLVFMRC